MDPLKEQGSPNREPIDTLDQATVWYREEGEVVKSEGKVEIYPNWIRLRTGVGTWIPRNAIESVIYG